MMKKNVSVVKGAGIILFALLLVVMVSEPVMADSYTCGNSSAPSCNIMSQTSYEIRVLCLQDPNAWVCTGSNFTGFKCTLGGETVSLGGVPNYNTICNKLCGSCSSGGWHEYEGGSTF